MSVAVLRSSPPLSLFPPLSSLPLEFLCFHHTLYNHDAVLVTDALTLHQSFLLTAAHYSCGGMALVGYATRPKPLSAKLPTKHFTTYHAQLYTGAANGVSFSLVPPR